MPETAVAERTLPHNLEAERSVLGAILLHNDAFNLAAEVIDSADFFRDAHRRIFDKMVKLVERGDAIDLVTLKEELGRSGEIDEVGGPAYIAALVDGVWMRFAAGMDCEGWRPRRRPRPPRCDASRSR